MAEHVMVPKHLLISDRFLDRVLDRLDDAADFGYVQDLARWDLKDAILETLEEVEPQ